MEVYMIKEATKLLGVESHVLRYWEEELGLKIQRNTMGHRYYTDRDIKLFKEVMELKDKGFSLKDIKQGMEKMKSQNEVSEEKTSNNEEENKEEEGKIVDFKVAQMQNMLSKMVANALNENKHIITSTIKSEITEDVMRQFDTVMREKEEKEEARFRKLDESLRQLQQANDEVAATKQKKRWFGKR